MFTYSSSFILTSAALLCLATRGATTTLAKKTTYTKQECAKFEALNFDMFNYAIYESYFDDDSKLTIAQSSVYQGPIEIEEYTKVTDNTSPYVDGKMIYEKTSPNLSEFDPSTGICEFTIYSSQGLVMNNDLTRGGNINFGSIEKIFYSIPDNNIPDIHVYYTTGFLSEFIERLDTYEVLEYVCGMLTGPSCEYANSFNGNMKQMKCMKQLSKLPLSEGYNDINEEEYYMDGNTFGCRAFHSVLAEMNPGQNCAHLSFVPVEDPKGNTKCQLSDHISPSAVFSDNERNELNSFCKNSPEIGSESCVKVFEAAAPKEVIDTCHDKRGKKGSFKVALDGKKKQRKHNCKWAAFEPEERCDLELKKGGFVWELCPKTCNKC